MVTKSFWVYVLRSKKDQARYVGGTSKTVEERLRRHNKGDCPFTSGHRPWIVLYKEKLDTKAQAIKREGYFKSGIGRQELERILAALT